MSIEKIDALLKKMTEGADRPWPTVIGKGVNVLHVMSVFSKFLRSNGLDDDAFAFDEIRERVDTFLDGLAKRERSAAGHWGVTQR